MANQLVEALVPFQEKTPLAADDYQAIGEAVMRIAYRNGYVRRSYGLWLPTQGELPSVSWERDTVRHRLLTLDDGNNYILESIGVEVKEKGIRTLKSVDQYVFGLKPELVDGMMRITHDISGKEKSAVGYLQDAKRNGAVRQDATDFRRRAQRRSEIRGFRRAFFGIMDRGSKS